MVVAIDLCLGRVLVSRELLETDDHWGDKLIDPVNIAWLLHIFITAGARSVSHTSCLGHTCLLCGHHRLFEVLPLGLFIWVGTGLAIVTILVDGCGRVVNRTELLRTLVKEVEVEDIVIILGLGAVRVVPVVLLAAPAATCSDLASLLLCIDKVHVGKLVEGMVRVVVSRQIAGFDEGIDRRVYLHHVVLVAAVRQQMRLRTVHGEVSDLSLGYQGLEVVGSSSCVTWDLLRCPMAVMVVVVDGIDTRLAMMVVRLASLSCMGRWHHEVIWLHVMVNQVMVVRVANHVQCVMMIMMMMVLEAGEIKVVGVDV